MEGNSTFTSSTCRRPFLLAIFRGGPVSRRAVRCLRFRCTPPRHRCEFEPVSDVKPIAFEEKERADPCEEVPDHEGHEEG